MAFNGAPSFTASFSLTARVAGGDVLVVCNNGAGALLAPMCDVLTGSQALAFNGNDAIALTCSGVVMDSIGQVGFDPITAWGAPPTSTLNTTLQRRCGVVGGDTVPTDPFDPAAEWVGFATDTFADLGLPTCSP